MSISVLVPVLGRPQNARPLAESLRATNAEAEIVFVVTSTDLEQLDAARQVVANERSRGCRARTLVVGWEPAHDYGRKMNHAFAETVSDWVLLGSDDITFDPGWDTEALRVAAQTGKRVIGTNDKANRLVMKGTFSTHTLVARSYIEEHGGCLEGPGFLVSEAYDHNFVDRELAALAMARNEWAFAPNSIIRHHHPAFGGAPQDATYEKGRDTFFDDQILFWERAERWGHVGLLPQELTLLKRSHKRVQRMASARARMERGR